jgi:hypothetical protein
MLTQDQVKSNNQGDQNDQSLFNASMTKETILQMAVKIERENRLLQQQNEDLMADIRAYESKKGSRRQPTGGKSGFPKGVSRKDFAAWNQAFGGSLPDGVKPLAAYQEAVKEGKWIPQPVVTRRNNPSGKDLSGWRGRKTNDQVQAVAGGWPSRTTWVDAIESYRLGDCSRPNLNFESFLNDVRTAMADPEHAMHLAAKTWLHKHPTYRVDNQ